MNHHPDVKCLHACRVQKERCVPAWKQLLFPLYLAWTFSLKKKSFSFQDPMLFSSAKLHYGLTQILPERSTDRKVAKTSTDNYSPVLAAMFSRKKSPLDRCCRPKVCAILSEMVPFPEPGGPMITARKILDISSEHFGTLDQITVVLKKRAIKTRVTSDSTIVSIQYMTHLHRR